MVRLFDHPSEKNHSSTRTRLIFILIKFNLYKLYPSKKCLGELERMNNISIDQNLKDYAKNDILLEWYETGFLTRGIA